MKTMRWHAIVGAVATAAFAASLAGPALAQTAAHSHDAAAPHPAALAALTPFLSYCRLDLGVRCAD